MDSATYGDIIFFALIAVYLAVKLSGVLGKKNDEDENFTSDISGNYSAKPATVPNVVVETKAEEVEQVDFSDEIKEFKFSDDKIKNTVEEIVKKNQGFSLVAFVEGAKSAFDLILKSFSEGDKKTLKSLLSAPLYKDFTKRMDEFSKNDLTPVKSLVSIVVDEISGAKLSGSVASIKLKFTTEQINFVKDEEDNVVDGDSSFIETIEDEWEFEKNLKSANPNWQIVAV